MKIDHVVLLGMKPDADRLTGAKCQHCGTELWVQLPLPVKDMAAVWSAFSKNHRTCLKR